LSIFGHFFFDSFGDATFDLLFKKSDVKSCFVNSKSFSNNHIVVKKRKWDLFGNFSKTIFLFLFYKSYKVFGKNSRSYKT